MTQAPDPELETLEVRLFLEAIHARYGYDLREYAAASIRRRVFSALAKSGLASVAELQHRALRDHGFFSSLLDDLTVHVSEMFRDPSFYRAVRTRVVPVLRTYPSLKIWLAGCANGEEVYGTAILLTEEGLYDRTQIYATDLSGAALDQAQQGIYSAEQMKTFSENYEKSGGRGQFSDWCIQAYDGIAMKESLRRNVSFFQHNLVSDHAFGEMHVVFCRNVLIYFGKPLRERVVRTLTQSLCPGGFLCLGTSERLGPTDRPGVFSEFSGEDRIYRYEG
jgi:chemotaxis protein methyltransferase CheR